SCRTGHGRQISLAARSRDVRSSLRSGRDGGKNTIACGPLHAALVCHTSSPRLTITVTPRLAHGAPRAGHSSVPRFLARIPDDFPHGSRRRCTSLGATSRDLQKCRLAWLIGPYRRLRSLTRGSCGQLREEATPGGQVVSPRVDREAFCRHSNVVVAAGQGGVGKTTVTAALARMAADLGLEVLVIELDDAGGLHTLFGHDTVFDYAETVLYEARGGGHVRGRVITPDDALVEYLEDHGLRRVAKRLVAAGVLEVVATAIPGIREILVLGKVKQLERSGSYDLIVLDAPAAG